MGLAGGGHECLGSVVASGSQSQLPSSVNPVPLSSARETWFAFLSPVLNKQPRLSCCGSLGTNPTERLLSFSPVYFQNEKCFHSVSQMPLLLVASLSPESDLNFVSLLLLHQYYVL